MTDEYVGHVFRCDALFLECFDNKRSVCNHAWVSHKSDIYRLEQEKQYQRLSGHHRPTRQAWSRVLLLASRILQ